MNSINARRVREQYPDYHTATVFMAALTLYRLEVKAHVLVEAPLSVFGGYLLHAIDLGADTPADIAHLLGVEERDIAKGPGVELLTAGLVAHGAVTQSGKRRLYLTERGKQQLKAGGLLRTPRQRTLQIHYDPLTRRLLPLEAGVTTREVVSRQGLYVLPYQGQEPRLADLPPTEVRDAALASNKRGEPFEVVSLLSMVKAYAEYLRDIEVFTLRHYQATTLRVVAVRNGRLLPDISRVLQQLHDGGTPIAPAEVEEALSQSADPPSVADLLPPHIAAPAAQLLDLDRLVGELTERQSGTQTVREHDELEKQLQELRAEFKALQHRLQNAVDYIPTEKHRPLLEHAFREAKQEVIIISPWMTRDVVDDNLCALIGKALQRGVRVRIGYGYRHERRPEEAARNEHNARQVIKQFESYRRNLKPGQLEFVSIREGTHEKILVCDTAFGVTTSLNWLSFHGARGDRPRRETGSVVYLPEAVEKLAARAREVFASDAQW